MKKVVFYLMAAALVFVSGCEKEDKNILVSGVKIVRDGVAVPGDMLGLVHDLPPYNTATLTAVVEPANATNKAVTWAVSAGNSVTVDNNGVVTTLRPGVSTVTVTTEDGNFKADLEVDVAENIIDVESVVIEIDGGGEFEVEEGANITLNAVITPANATRPSITWGSSNSAVASVDPLTGVVTGVVKNDEPVTITVVVSTPGGGNKSADCQVTVLPPGVLNQPTDGDIWHVQAILTWKEDFDVDSIAVYKRSAEGNDFVRGIKFNEEELEAHSVIITNLDPDENYRATIFGSNKESYNSLNFRTTEILGEIDVPANVLGASIERVVENFYFEDMVLNLAGGGAEYTVRFRIRTSIAVKGGAGGTKIITPGNQKIYGNNGKMQILFEDIHFYLNAANNVDIFNVDENKGDNLSIDVSTLTFKNCILENIGRNMWQTSDPNDVVDEFVIDNCLIIGQNSGNRRIIGWPNTSNKLGKIVIKNSTFIDINRAVNASLESLPAEPAEMELIVENCTFYDVVTGTENLFDFNNKHSKGSISNCIFANGKGETTNILRTRGEVTSTGNFHLNDFTLGSNVIDPITLYDKNSVELFENPEIKDFRIKDTAFPGSNAGDPTRDRK